MFNQFIVICCFFLASTTIVIAQENYAVIDTTDESIEFMEDIDTSFVESPDLYLLPDSSMLQEQNLFSVQRFYTALRGCSNSLIVEKFAWLLSIDPTLRYKIPCLSPLHLNHNPVINSKFGFRIHPKYKDVRFHSGVDMVTLTSRELIYATAQGVISKIAYDPNGYGVYIIIDHAYGYRSIYAHLEFSIAEVGQTVYTSTVLGKMGRTGNATGYHLHYSLMKNGNYIDPSPMLSLFFQNPKQ